MRKILLLVFIIPFFAYGQNSYFSDKDIYDVKIALSLGKTEAELSSIQSINSANKSFINEVDTAKKSRYFC